MKRPLHQVPRAPTRDGKPHRLTQRRIMPALVQAQLLAYLDDVDEFSIAKLITHGALSVHWAIPGAVIDFPIEMHMMSYNIDKRHPLSLIIGKKDPHDAPPNKTDFSVDLVFGGGGDISLAIPYIK